MHSFVCNDQNFTIFTEKSTVLQHLYIQYNTSIKYEYVHKLQDKLVRLNLRNIKLHNNLLISFDYNVKLRVFLS